MFLKETYKLELKNYEKEVLSLQREIRELQNKPQNSNYSEDILLNEIYELKNENKSLSDELCELKKMNNTLQSRVSSLH